MLQSSRIYSGTEVHLEALKSGSRWWQWWCQPWHGVVKVCTVCTFFFSPSHFGPPSTSHMINVDLLLILVNNYLHFYHKSGLAMTCRYVDLQIIRTPFLPHSTNGLPHASNQQTTTAMWMKGPKQRFVVVWAFYIFFLFLFINCSFFFFTIRLHLRYKHDIKLPPPHIITITIGKTGGSRCGLFQSGESLTNTYHIKAHLLTSCNKLCFTNGYIEISVNLLGSTTAQGSWPGVSLFQYHSSSDYKLLQPSGHWEIQSVFFRLCTEIFTDAGAQGQAGYGVTTEGMWPYSYDTCDLGTFPGQ